MAGILSAVHSYAARHMRESLQMNISKRTAVLVVVMIVAAAAIWFGLNRRGGEGADAEESTPQRAGAGAPDLIEIFIGGEEN